MTIFQSHPVPAVSDASNSGVALIALSTALPPNVLHQAEVLERSRALLGQRFAQFDRLAPAFLNAGIETRHSVVPIDWFTEPHGWVERTEAYVAGATELFIEATEAALTQAGLGADQIDVIVTVSSTGIATPTLEARAAARLGFRPDAMRVPVFGLGCAGGVSGLAIARDLAASRPGQNVLMVTVETCTLLFRQDRLAKADIIATALFGDGAAAAILRGGDRGTGGGRSLGTLGRGAQHMWPDSLNIMGWSVEETGLGVIFDRSIPSFAEAELADAVDSVMGGMGLTRADRFVCHPGGAKVIEAIETSLALPTGMLDAERRVLSRTGNMSAPTVLFVLEEALQRDASGQLVLLALGPGFTLSALPLRT
ncbi:type III polyketide synthase [Paracoccus sp. TK19116]|uniref:Type III polyketide synthase n=1 Tax=Paracoccus albicereus TaxID=2922394 RepID=A0ABT1MS82_9RHOB|nr:type III polyketide synthase [Paracoccus albicereus]MCQ0971153.1 type III polyketide synthase [Paracoccus albicereus]